MFTVKLLLLIILNTKYIMKTFLQRSFALIIIAFIVIPAASSCKKKETCDGRVKVVDKSTGIAVGAATVKLYAPNGQVTYQGVTDGSGDVSFEIKLPAIFNVLATKGTMTGEGILRVDEPGKKDAITVGIQ